MVSKKMSMVSPMERALNEGSATQSGSDSGSATTASNPPLPAMISARIERLPIVRWQILVRCVIGVVTFFDAFDMLMISYVLPTISKEWQLSPSGSTWAIVSGSAGMLVGAVALGWLADRFGRVQVIVVALLLYSLASLALALSPSFDVFLVLRFLQGVGIGGEVPVAATYINEIARSHQRGRFVLLYEMIFPLGVAIHGLVATLIVPTLGWRWLFVIGALPLPIIFFIRKLVPESPRWLASKGYDERALATMDYIECQVKKYLKEPLPEAKLLGTKTPRATAKGSWRELFHPPYLRRTLTLWMMWFTLSFVHLGVVNWLPTIYRQQFGLPLRSALAYAAINPWCALAGAFFVAIVIDRFGRRWTLGTALTMSGLILITLWLAGGRPFGLMVVCCALLAFVSTVIITGLYLYTPELYPTRVRALGASFGGVWSRMGAIAGPATFGLLLQDTASLALGFLVLGAVGVVGGVIALIFSEETSGRVLEEISP
jgi:MFS transporter, putative metabolite:H+ symporter